MKNCKAGPNLVMPDKTRYNRIQAAQIPAVMDKHFAAATVDQRIESVEAAVNRGK
jgi:(2Fe-2S) ferredoxin